MAGRPIGLIGKGVTHRKEPYHSMFEISSLWRRSRVLKGSFMRTYSAKPTEVQRAWHVIDADGLVLGRMCTEIATLLRGKHKPSFTPNLDTGDHVIVINAAKIILTSGKAEDKKVARHSGYPGGIRVESYAQLLSRSPEAAIRRTVHGMLPKGRLGRAQIKKLQVYSGAEHPHLAQQPQPVDMSHAKAR